MLAVNGRITFVQLFLLDSLVYLYL